MKKVYEFIKEAYDDNKNIISSTVICYGIMYLLAVPFVLILKLIWKGKSK